MRRRDGAVRFAPAADAAEWDRIVQAAPGGTVYHSWDWLELQHELLRVRVDRRLVLRDDEVIGVLPIMRTGPLGLLTRGMPFPYLGPVVPDDALADTVAAMRCLQHARGIARMRFELPPLSVGPRTAERLRGAGAVVFEESSVVIDIDGRTMDEVRNGYASPRRRNLKRAERDGVVVRAAGPGEFAAVIGEVLDEAYASHGRPSPYPADLGPIVERWSRDRDDVRLMVAELDGELVGALAMLCGPFDRVMMWIGGALRRARQSFPNVALHDAMFEDAVAGGYRVVDLSGWVDDAVGRYKLGYGGQRQTYLLAESVLVPQSALLAARRVRHAMLAARLRRAS